ncbi:hypothetical protein CDV31_016984 [Fusarium ambrosium]|uniref:Uncharacterized protein n=1 Tax=Fusarium ambrosium TaxID=131363 RepID=A0A428RWN4_9HYPO|nr:hypothetical protein CDV31_016984 [Fusarium ambrosium]
MAHISLPWLKVEVLDDRTWHLQSPVQFDPYLESQSIFAGQRKFVIVLPVDDSSHDLCKVVSSIVALGYPAPVIVNWKRDFHTDTEGIGPSQLGKITGTLDFLEWATGQDAPDQDRLGDDDLVLMLDAHDIWMQLPPSVLLYRYFSSNQRANKRLMDKYGFDKNVIEQTIVFSAQKGCIAPRDKISNLYCYDVPDSTLPPYVFGFLTDYKIGRWKFMRPKFVNSGSFLGPAGDMRRCFQRAKGKMDRDFIEISSREDLAGDQGIFAEVFGEQELWRKRARLDELADDDAVKTTAIWSQNEFEYHIGLDYTQELFYPTCYSEEGGYFVPIDNSSVMEKESSNAGVSPPRIRSIPADISKADFPLAKLSGTPDKDLTWGKVPLYVDFWTTAIPVAIHHNAWRHGLKSRRTKWWDKTWYFPYLRDLLEVQMYANRTTTPLATLDAKNGSLKIRPYHGEGEPKASLLFGKNKETRSQQLRAADWNTVCSNSNATAEAEAHWYDEVFRDGNGSL